jgi:oligopeptide/dipeptide ABC transporter ATP-binding protein
VVRHVSDNVAVMYLGKLTEIAPADDLFERARHPYTGALLSAVPLPDPDQSDQRQQIILVGDVPSPIAPPSGCRFHPRCPKAAPACVAAEPALEPKLGDAPQHVAACHFPMATGENLADFHPTIDAEERVIEGSGVLSGDGEDVAALAHEAVPDAPAQATEPEGSKQ